MRGKTKNASLIAILAGSAASVASAQSISTLFNSNNSGNPGGAVYFDAVVGASPITITGLDTNTSVPISTAFGFTVFVLPGTAAGSQGNAGAWTQAATGTGVAGGLNSPSTVTLGSSIVLAANSTYGIALVMGPEAEHSYSGLGASPAPGLPQYSNANVTLNLGSALNTPFSGTLFSPRIWNGTLRYTVGGVTGGCCRPDGSCLPASSSLCGSIAGSIYRGDGTTCATANCPQPASGACCTAAGGCSVQTPAQCTSQGGVYSGNGVTCVAANCPLPGACCLADASCTVAQSSACVAFAGIYRGNNSTCAAANCPTASAIRYSNGALSTGTTTLSGVVAPVGTQWSEVQAESPTCANGIAGYSMASAQPPAFRIADDFTITDADGWRIDAIVVYSYQTGSDQSTNPFTGGTIRIWNGPPNNGGSAVVFGDTTTNRLAIGGRFANLYRCFNTLSPVPTPPDTTRAIRENWFGVGATLLPGTYWIDVQLTGAPTNAAFAPTNTVLNQRGTPGANALQMTAANTWIPVADTGGPTGCGAGTVNQDFPFTVRGAVACYPNCDSSTSPPILNVNDFACFLNAYAAGNTYANCDRSTSPPVLNVNDFACFLNKYAAGCS